MLTFIKAGANGLGMGSELFDKKMIQEKNWEALQAHFQQFTLQLPQP
ncbi:MAG: hypothetical protein R2822_31130 [Spirosomataceae bacterium]